MLYSTVPRRRPRTQAAGKSKRRKVWECSHRDCGYRAPVGPHAARRPRDPVVLTIPDARLTRRWLTEQVRAGVIDWPAVLVDLETKQIELRGGAADEAPGAYKRLDEVLEAHADTILINHRLAPIGVAMAGVDVFDPLKELMIGQPCEPDDWWRAKRGLRSWAPMRSRARCRRQGRERSSRRARIRRQ